jgi:hypothetical protein
VQVIGRAPEQLREIDRQRARCRPARGRYDLGWLFLREGTTMRSWDAGRIAFLPRG